MTDNPTSDKPKVYDEAFAKAVEKAAAEAAAKAVQEVLASLSKGNAVNNPAASADPAAPSNGGVATSAAAPPSAPPAYYDSFAIPTAPPAPVLPVQLSTPAYPAYNPHVPVEPDIPVVTAVALASTPQQPIYSEQKYIQQPVPQQPVPQQPGPKTTNVGLPLMVWVQAPSDLEAGYTFEAEIHPQTGKKFICTVPPGGARRGSLILAPLPHDYSYPRLKAPTGRWKDGICDCCNTQEGCMHASCCTPYWCPFIALGQVMSRMLLDCKGKPGSSEDTKTAFCFMVSLQITLIVLFLLSRILPFVYLIFLALNVTGFIFMCQTRKQVRKRYQIPEKTCEGCEDCCCTYWCTCCTISQMLRHTGEYETYPGECCSRTGHPRGTPLTV